MQVSKQEAVQKAIADSAGEIAQLKQTAIALRDELETLQGDYEAKIQEMERARATS